jgi:N-acetylmuramoyl-L-alanine amidase
MRVPLAVLVAFASCSPAVAMLPSAPILPSQSRPLAPVILDPGHGGDDLGAVAHGVREKDVALAVARKLRDRLQSAMPVMLTRDDDRYVTLDNRVVDAVDWDGALFVSIHLNQVRDKRTSGAIVYSFGALPVSKRRLHEHLHRRHPRVPMMPAPPRVESRDSAALAGALVRGMRQDGFRVQQAKNDYYVLKDPSQPSILIELGYLSNADEAKRLSDPAYQDKIADSMAKALTEFAAQSAVRGEEEPVAVPAAPVPAPTVASAPKNP